VAPGSFVLSWGEVGRLTVLVIVKGCDTSGELKGILDSIDPHKKKCWVYQWFEGTLVSEKFLIFQGKDGKAIKRYQYTAIDDATRVRALKVYDRHTQANAIAFIDHVIARFPFRIREVRTDNGHEFQAKFHWHVEDQGIRHAYIKPSSPQLNGKVERSHRTDEQEFYQLLTYTGDVDLHRKLAEWERFYNLSRPHGAFNGKAPYEALRERL
jgi:transposase InsO family protein